MSDPNDVCGISNSVIHLLKSLYKTPRLSYYLRITTEDNIEHT